MRNGSKTLETATDTKGTKPNDKTYTRKCAYKI